MGTTIYRGSTPTIKLTPTNGMSVADLGEPTVAVVQELVSLFYTPDIDTANNCITCTLSEEDTLQLVSGADTEVQQMWKSGEGDEEVVIRFPIHKITVASSLVEELVDISEEYAPEPIPEPDTSEVVSSDTVEETT